MAENVTEAPVTDTSEETPVSPEQKNEAVPQKYKLGEEEFDEATLKKLVETAKTAEKALARAKEIEKGGRSKLEEAATLRKQFTAIKDIVLENPEAGLLEMAKIFGLSEQTIDRFWEQRASLQKRWEGMSDDQKARYMAEQKAAQLEQEKRDREQQDQNAKATQELRARQDAFEKKLAAETLPAMQEAGLHPTPLKLKLVAATLGAIADRDGPDHEPDLKEAVAYVAEAYDKDLEDSVKALDPEVFIRRYPELAEKLRKYEVARATGRPPAASGRPPAPPKAPQDGNVKQSWDEFSRQMRALQKGQRI